MRRDRLLTRHLFGSRVAAIECVRTTLFHQELLSALASGPGLILVTGSSGQGKTTAIEETLADPACPPDIIFVGDIREVADSRHAIRLARTHVVLGVLRIPRAAGAFGRLLDMGVSPRDLVDLTRAVFTTRLDRQLLIHERLLVSAAMRDLILDGADPDAIHRLAIADGMRGLREAVDDD